MPTFDVEGEPISITARDADRIVERLNANGSDAATNAAGKIERAMRLHESTAVSLRIGEDEVVLAALRELRATGDYLSALERLEHALDRNIGRER
jgi:hypothetical protein